MSNAKDMDDKVARIADLFVRNSPTHLSSCQESEVVYVPKVLFSNRREFPKLTEESHGLSSSECKAEPSPSEVVSGVPRKAKTAGLVFQVEAPSSCGLAFCISLLSAQMQADLGECAGQSLAVFGYLKVHVTCIQLPWNGDVGS